MGFRFPDVSIEVVEIQGHPVRLLRVASFEDASDHRRSTQGKKPAGCA